MHRRRPGPEERLHDGRAAGTHQAEEAHDLALMHGQVGRLDAVAIGPVGVAHREPLDLQDGSPRRPLPAHAAAPEGAHHLADDVVARHVRDLVIPRDAPVAHHEDAVGDGEDL